MDPSYKYVVVYFIRLIRSISDIFSRLLFGLVAWFFRLIGFSTDRLLIGFFDSCFPISFLLFISMPFD